MASASGPYFVDAKRHVYAIESGILVIHPPGYFVFNLTGLLPSKLLNVSAGEALQVLNVTFSVAGTAIFYALLSGYADVLPRFWLTLVYVCSPIVWFSADIHSTYAAMTFFAPLLILVLDRSRCFVLWCVVWAVMTAFRPSDGVFVIPWMIYHARRFSWKELAAGVSIAGCITAAWWIPTLLRYHGGLFSPLSFSYQQVHGLAQGVFTGSLGIHAAMNAFHATTGMIMTWGLLTPAVCIGMTRCVRNTTARSMTLFLAPGLAFFFFYYFSDATYLAYAAAAGLLLAGEYLSNRKPLTQLTCYALTACVSVLFMFSARPADGKVSRFQAVTDAYFVRYSVSSLKQQRAPRLATLLDKCDDSSVRGVCQ